MFNLSGDVSCDGLEMCSSAALAGKLNLFPSCSAGNCGGGEKKKRKESINILSSVNACKKIRLPACTTAPTPPTTTAGHRHQPRQNMHERIRRSSLEPFKVMQSTSILCHHLRHSLVYELSAYVFATSVRYRP